MITFPNPKINLGLNVVEKRPDGYHNLETILYPINVCHDVLEINRIEDSNVPCVLYLDGIQLDGSPEDNLVVKAYNLLDGMYHLSPVEMRLFKQIPAGAGMGGGSSDCAFAIKMLNKIFQLRMGVEEMENHAAKLGADCAFFIRNAPVFATEKGDVFERIQLSLSSYWLVLVKPNIHVATREAYANVCPHRPEVSLKEIVKRPVSEWKDCMKNDFEESVFKIHPEIAAIKYKLYDIGAVYASMTGSGSAVFGLFDTQIDCVESLFEGYFCRQHKLIE